MRIHTLFAAVVAIGLVGCSTTSTRAPETLRASGHACAGVTDLDSQLAAVYAPGAVKRVEPLYHQAGVNDIYGEQKFGVRAYSHTPPRHLEGASIYVAAPNTSPAYLERALTCHAASAAATNLGADPLRVAGVQSIDVKANGGQLRIDIRAADRAAGQQVLDSARGLHGNVSVMQVAAADAPRAAF